MASWNWPKLVNKIVTDIPGINTLLNALLKQDPEGTEDIPKEAKRWTDTPEGKQLQVFNGTTWTSVGNLAHDAASVDGFSASKTAQKNTIPVRDNNGKIPGDITGNANTATTAAALSAVNPVNKGGTGASTTEQARTNLGVPPTSHASTATTYGKGDANNYGHVKLSDTVSTSGVSSGTAATPKAVKDETAKYLPLTGGTMTGDINVESGATWNLLTKVDTGYTSGTAPSAVRGFELQYMDKNSKEIGVSQVIVDTDGNHSAKLIARNPNGTESTTLAVVYPKTGTPYAYCPTPPPTDNSTKIANTTWVNDKKYLPTTGGTVTGELRVEAKDTGHGISLYDGDKFIGRLVYLEYDKDNKHSSYVQLEAVSEVKKQDGGILILYTKDEFSPYNGGFYLAARNGSDENNKALIGKTDGTLTWDGKKVSTKGHTHAPSELTDAVPIAKGGTGATTAEAARKALGALASTDTAASATKLATARKITVKTITKDLGGIGGDIKYTDVYDQTASVTFDGSRDVTINIVTRNKIKYNSSWC